jgi:hypothetical protein
MTAADRMSPGLNDAVVTQLVTHHASRSTGERTTQAARIANLKDDLERMTGIEPALSAWEMPPRRLLRLGGAV